jgi:hypothetical protein
MLIRCSVHYLNGNEMSVPPLFGINAVELNTLTVCSACHVCESLTLPAVIAPIAGSHKVDYVMFHVCNRNTTHVADLLSIYGKYRSRKIANRHPDNRN